MNIGGQAGVETIAVAMSGGVDSSVAAALLKTEFEETGRGGLFGVTMRLGDAETEAIVQARAVAEHLGIEHHVIDCRGPFAEHVLRSCWDEYARGRTPNPCVVCNRRIKFGVLFEAARQLGATRLATGHHARLSRDPTGGSGVILHRGRDLGKDQSYFLARLTREQLAAALFPVGKLTKAEVRELARDRGLPSADSRESQDTCIVPDADAPAREGQFAETLCRRFDAQPRPGDFVDSEGRQLGRHLGVHRFTVGQRRGLGISLGRRAYVKAIDGARNRVVLTTDPDALLTSELRATDTRWLAPEPPRDEPLACQVQIRYRHAPVEATVTATGAGAITVRFDEPIRAVTPGQAAVLYAGDQVLASAWIE